MRLTCGGRCESFESACSSNGRRQVQPLLDGVFVDLVDVEAHASSKRRHPGHALRIKQWPSTRIEISRFPQNAEIRVPCAGQMSKQFSMRKKLIQQIPKMLVDVLRFD
jgi:hypothetical protein